MQAISRRRQSKAGSFHQGSDHFFCPEIFRSDLACRLAVPKIIGLDEVHCGQDIVGGREREQAFSRRQKLAEPRLLRDHRASGGEITSAAVAKPTGVRSSVLVSGDRELSARVLYVLPIMGDLCRNT